MSTQSLLPDNRTVIESALEQVLVAKLQAIPFVCPELWRADEVPVDLLPWLAQAKGVQRWGVDQSEAERREAVNSIWPLQSESGTRAAIARAMAAAGFEAEVVPWHKLQPKGEPYELQVTGWADRKPIAEEQRQDLLRRVGEAISERDVLTVRVGRQSRAGYRVAAVAQLGKLLTVSPYVVTLIEGQAGPGVAASVHWVKTINIQAAA